MKYGSHQQATRKIKAAAGFRHVLDLLAAEKKLIVGHNCFLGTSSSCWSLKGEVIAWSGTLGNHHSHNLVIILRSTW